MEYFLWHLLVGDLEGEDFGVTLLEEEGEALPSFLDFVLAADLDLLLDLVAAVVFVVDFLAVLLDVLDLFSIIDFGCSTATDFCFLVDFWSVFSFSVAARANISSELSSSNFSEEEEALRSSSS